MAEYKNPRPTSQPVGSTDQEVLYDNTITFDRMINSEDANVTNRKGNLVPSIAGIQIEINNALINAGGIDKGDYEDSPTLELFTEFVVFDRDGSPTMWKAKSTTPLPHTIDYATYPNPVDNPFIQPFVNDLTELEVVARIKNVDASSVSYLQAGSVTGIKYFYDPDSQSIYTALPAPITGNITAISSEDDTGTIDLTIDGSDYPIYKHVDYGTEVNIRDLGAVGDGVTDDTLSIRRAVATGLNVYAPWGNYVVTDEVTIIRAGQKIRGESGAAHYSVGFGSDSQFQHPCVIPPYIATKLENNEPVFISDVAGQQWFKATTFLVKDPSDSGVRYVKTRMKYRASAADPQDDPLSTVFNVQADSVTFEDCVVRLNLTGVPSNLLTDTVSNLGADWDVGIFVGSRLHFKSKNVSVVGYFRQACIWFDVSHCQYPLYPRFSDYRTGEEFPQGQGIAGGDGAELHNTFTFGGRWGVRVQGGEPLDSSDYDYGGQYYDEITGGLLDDYRGSFGFSDFLLFGCDIYGPDHHTNWRIYDMEASPSVENDAHVGGALSVSGLAANSSRVLQGHRYIDTRFSTKAPFKVRLHGSQRDMFIGCHMENYGLVGSYDHSGNEITEDSDSVSFGNVAKTTATLKTKLVGCNAYTYNRWFTLNQYDSVISPDNPERVATGSNILVNNAPISTDNGYVYNYMPDGGVAAYHFSHDSDAFYASLRFIKDDNQLQYRLNNYSGVAGVVVESTNTSGSDVIKTYGGTYINISSRYTLRNRSGDDLLNVFATGNADFLGMVRPSTDNTVSLGSSSQRWSEVFASNGTINTSDEREKTFLEIEQAEINCAKELRGSIKKFKWNDAIKEKGDGARIHFGVGAQTTVSIFEKHGLDPFKYGIVCYDEWDANEENGTESGNRYGIRYEQLLCFIIMSL